jgi:TRAP-type C4-dicarboxylate transport system substrate-binding protein
MDELTETVQKKTDGKVRLRFYPGGIQGDEGVVLRKMMTGQLHGAGLTGVGLGEVSPELRVLELPLMFRSQEEVRRVHEKLDAQFEKILAERGFTLLGWSEVGFVYLFSKKPVRNGEDLKRLKVWLWEGDPLAEAFLKELDVSPVPLSVTDVMTGLQTGLVDAVYVSPMAAIALQWFTRVDYMTKVPLTHALGAVVVKTEQIEKLSPEDRRILMAESRDVFRRLAEATAAENKEAEKVLQERGITFVDPDASIQEEFKAIGRRVWDELAGELYSKELLDRVLGAVREARASASG